MSSGGNHSSFRLEHAGSGGMRTFGFCISGTDCRGFTLIEILVVLIIAAMLAGIALPRLQQMVQSVEIANQRRSIINQLEGLGYRAFASGKPIRLASMSSMNNGNPEYPQFQIPVGWRLQAKQPIEYAFNGICSGGIITLIDPANRGEFFKLKAPLCRLDPLVHVAGDR